MLNQIGRKRTSNVILLNVSETRFCFDLSHPQSSPQQTCASGRRDLVLQDCSVFFDMRERPGRQKIRLRRTVSGASQTAGPGLRTDGLGMSLMFSVGYPRRYIEHAVFGGLNLVENLRNGPSSPPWRKVYLS